MMVFRHYAARQSAKLPHRLKKKITTTNQLLHDNSVTSQRAEPNYPILHAFGFVIILRAVTNLSFEFHIAIKVKAV